MTNTNMVRLEWRNVVNATDLIDNIRAYLEAQRIFSSDICASKIDEVTDVWVEVDTGFSSHVIEHLKSCGYLGLNP